MSRQDSWIIETLQTLASYRRMIDGITVQLSDEELFARPAREFNSVAIILRHLGGNLQSRWTNFLTTDGEKATRDRDQEFTDWNDDRESLIKYFDDGWSTLIKTLSELDEAALEQTVTIRGEPQLVTQAILRAITHIAYHVGQIALIARLVHDGPWQWLTIAPNQSHHHNQSTWGTSASRSVFGQGENEN
ncbi:DinB family protein [Roseiconus lacunae]|uniref:DinB family protein n=1 Tax=Roseiconus lacunae TaxID=2605694 RepID=A0ABT7PFJ5_9BACT|nr:DinB family protein [Roseiconus lacunae]MDM4015257.1 DinB family protein [Roseiconus lacunae]